MARLPYSKVFRLDDAAVQRVLSMGGRITKDRKGVQLGSVMIRLATGNGKLRGGRPVHVTCVSRYATCPSDCGFRDQGCYGEDGKVQYVDNRLNNADAASPSPFAGLAAAIHESLLIDCLPPYGLLRSHVIGDVTSDAGARAIGAAIARWTERADRYDPLPSGQRRAWAYTHAWRTVSRAAWGAAIEVQASCFAPEEADAAAQNGYTSFAFSVAATSTSKGRVTVGNVPAVMCPSQSSAVHCGACTICRTDARSMVFVAHGTASGARKARTAIARHLERIGSDAVIPVAAR